MRCGLIFEQKKIFHNISYANRRRLASAEYPAQSNITLPSVPAVLLFNSFSPTRGRPVTSKVSRRAARPSGPATKGGGSAVSVMTPSRDITRLLEIMAALRTPGTGCPWDLEQTFETIAPYTIEEAYEVADAIARGDLDDLRDELGDLLLQVVFHARMAQEQGAFDFADVVESLT